MKKNFSILPTQSLAYFIVCGAGILAFTFLIIIPNQNISAQLDQEIKKLNNHIEQQRVLRPVFDSLLERAKKENPTDFPEVKKVKLERGEINKISRILQDMAGQNDLKIQDIRADVNEIMNNTGYLLMRIHVTGGFMNFREFLVNLGTLPYLELIEEIKIRAIEVNREYKLRIWVAQN